MNSGRLEQFRNALALDLPREDLIFPSDESFENARLVYNRMHDRRPAAILRTLEPASLRVAIALANRFAVPIALRGGGHHIGGFSAIDDGLLVDFSTFRGVRFERSTETVVVEPGARLSDLDRELERYGRCVPLGTVSDTGVAGLTLGGGIGWLVCSLGLTCDWLDSAQILLASGQIVEVSADSYSQLFSAVRGGGVGAFGIILELRYRTSTLPKIVAGSVRFEANQFTAVLTNLQKVQKDREFRSASVAPVALRHEGRVVLSLDVCCIADGLEDIAALKQAVGGDWGDVREREFSRWQSAFDVDFLPPKRGYWKSLHFKKFDLDSSMVLSALEAAPFDGCSILIEFYNPDTLRMHEFGSAYPLRDSRLGLLLSARWERDSDDEAHIKWVRHWFNALHAPSSGVGYSNYSGAEDGGVRSAYPPSAIANFRELAAELDPESLFTQGHRRSLTELTLK